MPNYRVCGREWCFGKRTEGVYSALTEGEFLRTYAPDGSEIPAPPDASVCAGKYLWEEREICTLPMFVRIGDERRMLMATETANRVTQVTAEAGRAYFEPDRIPLSCAHPLIGDPFPWGERTVRLTAVRVGRPYAVIFLETAGDCAMIGHLPTQTEILPQGIVFLYVYAADEKRLYVRTSAADAPLTAEMLCAAAAAGVAVGRCRPDTVVTFPIPDGEARVVCRRDRSLLLTLPVAPA